MGRKGSAFWAEESIGFHDDRYDFYRYRTIVRLDKTEHAKVPFLQKYACFRSAFGLRHPF